ncbi:MAG: NRDE family protein [Desulfobacteraceae bacterium]|jgi:uncharacterized protein with NRDE domain
MDINLMCLILFSYEQHPHYRLVLAANRDEFYDRPTAPLGFWQDHPDLLAGRDLKSFGTWMGLTRSGKIAAITNYREPETPKPQAPSRGQLISDFLIGSDRPAAYLKQVKKEADDYNGFNLLVGDTHDLFYYSNRGGEIVRLESNIYGLSNRQLDTQWPKVNNGKKRLKQLLDDHHDIPLEQLLSLLQSQDRPPDDQLPDTGVSKEWERALSPLFIASPGYGTRCSTILTIDRSNHLHITEYTWKNNQTRPVLLEKHAFDLKIGR